MHLATSTSLSPTHTTKMLERVLSSRRAPAHADEAANDDDEATVDESKTKKHLPISFFTTRATNYFTRLGPLWPCLGVLFLVLLLIFSLIFNSRSFVCVSPYNPVSRSGYFGFDGLESDFESLGVPWCKCSLLGSDLRVITFDFRSGFSLCWYKWCVFYEK